MTSQDKAERAWNCIDYYADNESLDEAIIDILTDLMLLCKQENISFVDCHRIAFNHFTEESK